MIVYQVKFPNHIWDAIGGYGPWVAVFSGIILFLKRVLRRVFFSAIGQLNFSFVIFLHIQKTVSF